MTLLLALATAWAGTCTEIDAGDILAVTPPAVIVLGERPGVARDGRRARRVVRKLNAIAPTTLAIEVIDETLQPTLDRYSRGEIPTERLDVQLEWEQRVGLPYSAYSPVLTSAVDGVKVVGIGSDTWNPPEDMNVPVSPAYLEVLRDTMGTGFMPRAAEGPFLRFVSWRDHELARRSLEAWNGSGYLVILSHRSRIEGGYGIPFQLHGLTDANIDSFVLAWGGEPPCYDGDKVWSESVWEQIFGH
jgi:hypothetical protein